MASSPTKRKRDPLKEINGKETSTTVARTVKVGRQNFTHCKLCNDSFPTAKCDDNPKLNKQFCATCWALKKPECEDVRVIASIHIAMLYHIARARSMRVARCSTWGNISVVAPGRFSIEGFGVSFVFFSTSTRRLVPDWQVASAKWLVPSR